MSEAPLLDRQPAAVPRARPRLGFLGLGWIGRHRLEALLAAGAADCAAISDPSESCLAEARTIAPAAETANDLDALLALDLDGVVIATPSAQHADQAIRALDAGIPVFCQKPLGRSAAEAAAVVDAARRADRLLAVDLSYRFTEGAQRIRDLVQAGELGQVFALDLVFHNAYGPDKPWFYDAAQSGGGCVMDLGVHLVDLALWLLDFPAIASVASVLRSKGRPLSGPAEVEDYATAQVELDGGATLRLACSWKLQGGQDAEISAAVYGQAGGAALRNVGGSFYDFTAERFRGTSREVLATPPDDWGGRAAVDWARRLATDASYDPACERLVDVSAVLDRIYGR